MMLSRQGLAALCLTGAWCPPACMEGAVSRGMEVLTGYAGAVCGASSHYRSCIQALQPGQDRQTVVIDLDGSGPLPPAPLL